MSEYASAVRPIKERKLHPTNFVLFRNLHCNQLKGSIPNTIGQLTNIKELYVSRQALQDRNSYTYQLLLFNDLEIFITTS